MGITTIKPALDNYLSKLRTNLKLDGVYLYGSWAEDKATPESDVDILVLSHDFSRMSEDDRDRILYRFSACFPLDLHIYGLTPDEYKSASRLTTIGSVRDSGKLILLDK